MTDQLCDDAKFILGPIAQIVIILRWAIPVLLILLVIWDLIKVVAGQVDEKAKKDAFSKIVKRVIYALIVFMVPAIVNFILLQIEPITEDPTGAVNTNSTSYLRCWNKYYNE